LQVEVLEEEATVEPIRRKTRSLLMQRPRRAGLKEGRQ